MEPMEPTTPTDGIRDGTSEQSGAGASSVVWGAVARGAACGLVVLIVVAVARAVLERQIDDFDDSGWNLPLFALLVVGYLAAGWIAQRRAAAEGEAGAPLTHGALAGLGAFVAWVPIRIVIWLARDEGRGLFRGSDAALRPGQIFGALVISAGIGMVGGYLSARGSRRRREN